MKKQVDKVGICRHLRLRKETDEAFETEANRMGIAVATYIRLYLEKCFADRGVIKYGK